MDIKNNKHDTTIEFTNQEKLIILNKGKLHLTDDMFIEFLSVLHKVWYQRILDNKIKKSGTVK
jgi:hypothetical protein